jgi:hypothetical protein
MMKSVKPMIARKTKSRKKRRRWRLKIRPTLISLTFDEPYI